MALFEVIVNILLILFFNSKIYRLLFAGFMILVLLMLIVEILESRCWSADLGADQLWRLPKRTLG